MKMALPIMNAIYAYGRNPSVHDSPEALAKIGIMIDCLVGSAQVHAVEKGLDGSVEEYRQEIRRKLEQLNVKL